MSWIEQIPLQQATGLLKQEYDKAVARAGRLWRVVQIMSINPRVLRSSMAQYSAIMRGKSPLSRMQRETWIDCVHMGLTTVPFMMLHKWWLISTTSPESLIG